MRVGILRRVVVLSFIVVVSSFAVSLRAQTVKEDITYTTGPEGDVKGDVYEPSGAGPFPAIVYIHGGSWRTGNKKAFKKMAEELAGKDYAGFSIDYDLKEHSWPISFEQSQEAVRFLRKHAAEYKIDPAHIFVAGGSAGGQLAALVALAPQGPITPSTDPAIPQDDVPATVSGAMILNGASEMELPGVGVISRYIGGDCAQKAAECKDASPQAHVHAGAPPFFVGHGTADTTVPYTIAQNFIKALRTDNVPVETYVAEGGPHSYWQKPAFYEANIAAMLKFLDSVVHPAAATARLGLSVRETSPCMTNVTTLC